jgi:hypothetical protein
VLVSVGRKSDKDIYIYAKIEYACTQYESLFNLNTGKRGSLFRFKIVSVNYEINTTLKEEDRIYESNPSVLLRSSFIDNGFFDAGRNFIRRAGFIDETAGKDGRF